MNTPLTVTIPDAVKISGMSRTSIYEALKRGDLSAHKAGRRTLIPYAELESYLAALPQYRPDGECRQKSVNDQREVSRDD